MRRCSPAGFSRNVKPDIRASAFPAFRIGGTEE